MRTIVMDRADLLRCLNVVKAAVYNLKDAARQVAIDPNQAIATMSLATGRLDVIGDLLGEHTDRYSDEADLAASARVDAMVSEWNAPGEIATEEDLFPEVTPSPAALGPKSTADEIVQLIDFGFSTGAILLANPTLTEADISAALAHVIKRNRQTVTANGQ